MILPCDSSTKPWSVGYGIGTLGDVERRASPIAYSLEVKFDNHDEIGIYVKNGNGTDAGILSKIDGLYSSS